MLSLLDEVAHRLDGDKRFSGTGWRNDECVDPVREILDRLPLEVINDELLLFRNSDTREKPLPRLLNGAIF